MIKILKKGEPKVDKVYKLTCDNCNSIIECQGSDLINIEGRYNEQMYYIVCPECCRQLWVEK